MAPVAAPKTARDLPGAKPRKDTARETQDAIIENIDATDDRDLAHGEGGTIDLPRTPRDLSQDD